MFFVSRQFSAGGDEAKAAAWTAPLRNAGFRRAMRVLTIGSGLACLLEATLGVAAAFLLPPGAALVAELVLGIGTVVGLLAWAMAYARRRLAQAPDNDAAETARA